MNDSYHSVARRSEAGFRDRGSRFLGFILPVEHPDEVKWQLENLKKEYHDARHHCYAYRIGLHGEDWRINDDGEPSGSAGKPIFGQLLSFDISDVLAVVVRYFGGTKLGIPGLINAYRTVTREAIVANDIVQKIRTQDMSLLFDYPSMNSVMKMVKEENLEVISSDFSLRCALQLRVKSSEMERLKWQLSSIQGLHIHEM